MNELVSDYIFHYNSNTKFWAAIPREKYVSYWNDYTTPGVIRSKSISTLIEIINKGGDGFIKKLEDNESSDI